MRSVHSSKQRMVWIQPERGFFVHAVSSAWLSGRFCWLTRVRNRPSTFPTRRDTPEESQQRPPPVTVAMEQEGQPNWRTKRCSQRSSKPTELSGYYTAHSRDWL